MNTLQLMEIKDRTWTIQACSAVTKEGMGGEFHWFRSSGWHGVARQDHFRKEVIMSKLRQNDDDLLVSC
jgi:hypothetical protein